MGGNVAGMDEYVAIWNVAWVQRVGAQDEAE